MMKVINQFYICVLCLVFLCSTGYAATVSSGGNEKEKIMYIQQQFDNNGLYSSIWWYGWMGVYGASAAASLGVGLTSDNKVTKITQVVSGVQSLLGFAGIAASPMTSAYAGSRLRSMPENTPEEIRIKLKEAERFLNEASNVQSFGSSWISHSLNLAVGAGGALVIWKGYGNEIKDAGGNPKKEALVNFLLSFIVGELQIFTQPTAEIKGWDDYRTKYSHVYYNIIPQFSTVAALNNGLKQQYNGMAISAEIKY